MSDEDRMGLEGWVGALALLVVIVVGLLAVSHWLR